MYVQSIFWVYYGTYQYNYAIVQCIILMSPYILWTTIQKTALLWSNSQIEQSHHCIISLTKKHSLKQAVCMCVRHGYVQYQVSSLFNRSNCCFQGGRCIHHLSAHCAGGSNYQGCVNSEQNEAVFFVAPLFRVQCPYNANIQFWAPICTQLIENEVW